ncbi:N-acetyltransferase [Streptomyces sp. Ag109_O5-1]|uniref:GNAT family N-acetyltransferase n=1 Tax=Streptomyces sp. Ag109_O5-1 TaxID=1938851 RepID=UPI0021A75B1C|nr:GNAT family N-acetyltransferase [Streptomyces sp. Ag109_O5-1]
MASTSSGSVSQLSVRCYEAGDEQAVLDLIDADRLPGQSSMSAAMVAEALAGRSPVDGSRWADLHGLVTEVIHDGVRVLGVISYAVRPSDGAGLALWLHCLEEEPALAQALIVRALDRLGSRPVYAFEFASALAPEVGGLPARSRPGTRRALERSGFTARDRWRYFQRLLPTAPLGVLSYPVAEMSECADSPGWQLCVREPDGTAVAQATIGRPVNGAGVLRWISTDPAHRGRGLGHSLLTQCLIVLAEAGAREVIACVPAGDDASGAAERDPAAAICLFESAGFSEIDRLVSFIRRP